MARFLGRRLVGAVASLFVVSVLVFVGVQVLPGNAGGGHYLIMSFAARWIAKEPVLNEELDDFKWLSPGAFGDLEGTQAGSVVVHRAGDDQFVSPCSSNKRRQPLANCLRSLHLQVNPST